MADLSYLEIDGEKLTIVDPVASKKISELEEAIKPKETTTPIDKGGTGATTAKGAEYNIIGSMEESTAEITDDTPIIVKRENPNNTDGVTMWKKASLLWNYIKNKADSFYAKSSHVHDNATTSTSGFMSSDEKKKLAGIADGANKYTLPTASSSTKGGAKIGYTQSGKKYPVQLDNEKMYVEVPWSDTTYQEATQSNSGLMSADDKKSLSKYENALGTVTGKTDSLEVDDSNILATSKALRKVTESLIANTIKTKIVTGTTASGGNFSEPIPYPEGFNVNNTFVLSVKASFMDIYLGLGYQTGISNYPICTAIRPDGIVVLGDGTAANVPVEILIARFD